MPIKLSFERQILSFHTDVITVGRDPLSQVAFPNDSRLAMHHAVLRNIGGRWMVESREGGPIRIGEGRPSPFAWLNPGDVIYLSESGPQLIFDPVSHETAASPSNNVPSKTVQTPPVPAPVVQMPPSGQFSRNAGDEAPKPGHDDISRHLGPHASQPVTANQMSEPNVKIASKAAFGPMMISGVATFLLVSLVAGWAFFNQGTPANIVKTPSEPVLPIVIPESVNQSPVVANQEFDPREFLVLIGFGDLKSDDPPLVLGVGWLWDDRTTVTSRSIGTAIDTVAQAETNPRQGCVIRGQMIEVSQVIHPTASKEISILRMKDPLALSKMARDQWLKMNVAEVAGMRSLGKRFRYFSFDALPRSVSLPESYDLPLCEYDNASCRLNGEEIRLDFNSPGRFVESTNLARGGLIVDESGKIVGMAPLYSPIVWTETLERVLSVR